MPELLTRPGQETTGNPHERYEEIYRKEKAELFAFAMDKRDDSDYAPAVLGYCGAGGDVNQFSFSIGDLFNTYLTKGGKREQIAGMREHVADYRHDFTAMLIDVFGPAYDDFLSPLMTKNLWDETCRMLADKYRATSYTIKI
jgi:hypothetical protein